MKNKNLIFGLLSLMVSTAAVAQSESKWAVKPMAGMTVATLTGDDTSDISSSLAWAGGVEASFKLSDRLSLSSGVIYTRERIKSDSRQAVSTLSMSMELSNARMTFERINVPLMADLHLGYGISLKAGLQAGLRIGYTMTMDLEGFYVDWVYDSFNVDSSRREVHVPVSGNRKSHNATAIRTFDLSVPVGLSYEWKNVELDVRYHFGLTNIMKDQNAKRRYLMVTLGYNFQL
jgi:hypothetical protein